MSEKHLGRIELSGDLFEQILHGALLLPADAKIIRIEIYPDWLGRWSGVSVYVEQPDQPIVHEGEMVPLMCRFIATPQDIRAASWIEEDE